MEGFSATKGSAIAVAMIFIATFNQSQTFAAANKECAKHVTGFGWNVGISNADYYKPGSFEKRQLAETRAKVGALNSWARNVKRFQSKYSIDWGRSIEGRISCEFEGEQLESDLETGSVTCKATARPCRTVNPSSKSKFKYVPNLYKQ